MNVDQNKIEKKLKLAADLFEFCYEIKRHQLEKKYPNMTEKSLNHLTYSLFEKGGK